MPIAFLAPAFLLGLAALAVPVIVHLANRPKKQVVEFPSLMFLERVEYQDSSKRRLRDLLLFALRVLALILLVGAFARPFVDRPDAPAVAVDGGTERVVLLDRSASMAVEDRMERARRAVGEVAASLERGDRATLVVFDHGAAAANRATDQARLLTGAADTTEAGSGATRYAPALRLAESLLTMSPLPRRELVVISDFQRTGWQEGAAPRMPAGTVVHTVAVGAPVSNAAVTDVRVDRERFSGRDRARLTVRVVNRGSAAFDAPVELLVDGRSLESRPVEVAAGGEATVAFSPVTLADGPTRVTVDAGRDVLPADNRFHLVLEPGRGYRVLVVAPPGGETPYLERALEVGGENDVARVRSDRFDASDLADVDVVVLDGADPTGSDDASALRRFTEAGGGLVVVLGERSRAGRWEGEARALLPGTIEGTRDRGSAGGGIASLRYDHPLLQPFRNAPAGLTGARFYRYRELEPAAGADVLARFDDGAPALVAGRAGAGRVLALTTPLDGRWSDLVLQPGFVPLVHGLVRHAAGRQPVPASRRVGDLLDAGTLAADGSARPGRSDGPAEEGAESGAGRAGDRRVLVTPSGGRLDLSEEALQRLDEAGFYELRDPRSSTPTIVAVNLDPTESALEIMASDVLRDAVSGGEAVAAAASLAPEDRERHQSLWWYALAAAFVIMVVETALANRLSRRPLPAERGRA